MSRRSSRRFAAGTAVGATLALSLTGCLGESGSGSAGGMQLTAAQVLEKASQKTSQVDTYKTDYTMNIGAQQGAMNMHATAQFRLKPSTAFTMNVDKMSVGGQSMSVGAIQLIYLDKIIYMKNAQLAQATGGKPWLKIDLTGKDRQAGFDLDSLLNQTQLTNPAEQTKMLTASKDAREVGKETINGIQTTHYTGSMTVQEALAELDAKTRAEIGKAYQEAGGSKINFDLWADAEQLPRKLITKIATAEGAMTMTMVYLDYGKSMSVNPPPAEQVGDFKGLTGS